jgi:cytochrome c oxidase subunit II
MASEPTTAGTSGGETNHGRIVIVAWIVLSLIATPLVAVYLGPIIPPGNGTAQGQEQVFDNQVMTALITPLICLLLVFFVYVLGEFRARAGSTADGPPIRGDSRVQAVWVASTTVVVLFLAGFGTFELLQTGSGGGQGPSPIAYPANHKDAFEVQVIGQQWEFTYRYPSLGGMETNQLVLPAHTDVAFHVTSLDVVHSFWAIELGIKADANPGVDNVAYAETRGPMTFHVRCAELCGLWHGYMFNNGRIVDPAQFQSWAKQAEANYAPIAKYVPKYAHTYLPDPQRRAG